MLWLTALPYSLVSDDFLSENVYQELELMLVKLTEKWRNTKGDQICLLKITSCPYIFISGLVRCYTIFVLFGDAVLTDPAEEPFCWTFFSWKRAPLSFYALCSFSIKNSINHSTLSSSLAYGDQRSGYWLTRFPLESSHHLPGTIKGQVIAFAIWMVCAYAMYLLIPLMFSYKKWFSFNFQTSFVREWLQNSPNRMLQRCEGGTHVNFELTKEQQMVREMVKDFAKRRLLLTLNM